MGEAPSLGELAARLLVSTSPEKFFFKKNIAGAFHCEIPCSPLGELHSSSPFPPDHPRGGLRQGG